MAASKNHARPEFVFVGAKTYEVAFFTEEEWAHNHFSEGDQGLTYASSSQIYIRLMPGVMEATLQQTLLHEVLHAVWAETYLTNLAESLVKDETALEETIIGVMSPSLLFVLQQNPQLVAYLNANGAVRRA